jgi:hypothetical protein
LEYLPIDEYDTDSASSGNGFLLLPPLTSMMMEVSIVEPTFTQCRRLKFHVHSKLAELVEDPLPHWAAMVCVNNDTTMIENPRYLYLSPLNE